MLVLLLSSLMILASCGTQIDVKDPQVNVDGGAATATKDEEKAKEEENAEVTTATTSSSSSKSSSTSTTTVTGSQEVLAAVIPPSPTKLKKGLTKEQVLSLLGPPDRIDDWDVELHWVYIEKEGEEKYCLDYYDGGMDDDCYVSFDADSDLVNSQDSFNTDYIDLLGF